MGMTPIHVNIASDEILGASVHIALPAAPVGTFPSLEVTIPQGHPPGVAKHKITGTVFHRKRGIVLHGHDCGMGIPDEAPPVVGQLSGYLPIIMLKSSRKVMFAASTVKGEGTAIGGVTASDLPMLTCGEPVPFPAVFSQTSTANTVLVGFSQSDIDRGWEDIAAAVAIEAVCFVVSIVTMNPLMFGASDVVAGVLGVDPLKTGLGAAVGLGTSIKRSAESGWTEPISLKVETGGGAEGAGVEAKWTPATNEGEVTAEYNLGPGKGAAGAKRDKDGNWKGTGAVPPDLFE